MKKLEKILEELDQEVKEYMEIDFGDEYNAGIKDMAKMAKKIIRKYLSRENTSKITRSSRDNRVECNQREMYIKAYEDALKEDGVSKEFLEDCKRTAQKYKKDNDDWVSVEERLPEKFGKYWATIRYNDGRISDPVVVDFLGIPQKYVVDTPDGREYETWGIDSAFHGSRVIAWRPYYIPEPYRPERSNDEKE